MENKNIKTKISGIGEIEISILQTGEDWWCKEIESFVTNSEIRFSVIAMTRPELRNNFNFQSILQRFITFIQRGGQPQTANLICNHFNNWINTQNGTINYQSSTKQQRSNLPTTIIIRPDKTYDGTF